MTPDEYAKLVAEIARQHVCENKPFHKAVAKAVIRFSPMAVLANSLREPTEEELLAVVSQHNPFAAEDLSEELRPRYTAICKLHLDVKAAIKVYREERLLPHSYRILATIDGRYLTWGEADPNRPGPDCDDLMAEFADRQKALAAAESYAHVMALVRADSEVEVVAFNRYHERIQ